MLAEFVDAVCAVFGWAMVALLIIGAAAEVDHRRERARRKRIAEELDADSRSEE